MTVLMPRKQLVMPSSIPKVISKHDCQNVKSTFVHCYGSRHGIYKIKTNYICQPDYTSISDSKSWSSQPNCFPKQGQLGSHGNMHDLCIYHGHPIYYLPLLSWKMNGEIKCWMQICMCFFVVNFKRITFFGLFLVFCSWLFSTKITITGTFLSK